MAGISLGKPKILIGIVDDHIYTATFIAQELDNKGFKTFQAYNGPDAIKLIKDKKPDLAIIDLLLSGMSGFDVASSSNAGKIIFMTSDDEFAAKAKNFRNSVGVVGKPVNISELMVLINKTFKISEK